MHRYFQDSVSVPSIKLILYQRIDDNPIIIKDYFGAVICRDTKEYIYKQFKIILKISI